MLNKILNIRHGMKNQDLEEVKKAIPQMAKELAEMDYRITHNEEALLREWELLKHYGSNERKFSVRMRLGMKMCEHFFPNFYDIKNPNGKSFSSEWNEQNLVRTLESIVGYNESLYLSTIRSKLYLYSGLTKSTMYRPYLAKVICDTYGAKVVLDPCCGFGGRMLGAVASGAKYIGFEPNKETYDNLMRLAQFLKIEDKIEIYNTGAENMLDYDFEQVDLILTSPPYFDVEIYCEEDSQSYHGYSSYVDWCNGWLFDVIGKAQSKLKENGVSCWNVHNFERRNMPMIDDIGDYQKSVGFEVEDSFVLINHDNAASIRRGGGHRPSSPTIVYKRTGVKVETHEFVATVRTRGKGNVDDTIYLYDKDTGAFVKEYKNVTEAAEALGIDRGNLYGVIDTRHTRKGYFFKRSLVESIDVLPWICEIGGKRFRTIVEVAEEYGISKQAVSISRKRGSKKIQGQPVTWNNE